MASTILYKFRSGTNFEALPLPGSAARLFDVKRAIVKAKKLDASGSLEFDLSIRNADTDEEYADESMLLPRGTRVVVQRLPAARGHGFLARMARVEAGMTGGGAALATATANTSSSFYTIESHGDDQDEFVSTKPNNNSMIHDEEKELAALKAVTETANAAVSSASSIRPGGGGFHNRPPGDGGPPHVNGGAANPNAQSRPGGGGGGGNSSNYQGRNFHQRPNADPELREQEQKLMPKKRATGIPRTFLNLKAAPVTDGVKGIGDGTDAANNMDTPMLQPNVLGFEELKNRGGGQSESASGTKRDLEYALKLTGMSIPEELQCGICHGVVKNAMLLAWDPEGRTACENCIRDALAQNGFRCPLTGMEGVSPDDLHPNYALRKAAERFINNVMEKMEEIDQQQLEEDVVQDDVAGIKQSSALLEGDRGDTGVIVSRKLQSRRRKADDDPFGGDNDDDFGGDVFAVEAEKIDEDEEQPHQQQHSSEEKMLIDQPHDAIESHTTEEKAMMEEHGSSNQELKTVNPDPHKNPESSNNSKKSNEINSVTDRDVDDEHADKHVAVATHNDDGPETPERHENSGRRDMRRRGPPVGYAMGPAGGAAVHASASVPAGRSGGGPHHHPGHTERFQAYNEGGQAGDQPPSFGGRGRSPYGGGRGGGFFSDRPPFRGGRGRRGGGRFPGRYNGGRYNDWQQGRGGRWGETFPPQAPAPLEPPREDLSNRDDVSLLLLCDKDDATVEPVHKRHKRNSRIDDDSLDSSNKIVAMVPCTSQYHDCSSFPIQDTALHSHEGGGDDESRGTKRSRACSDEGVGGESHQPRTNFHHQDDHKSNRSSRHHHDDDHHSRSRHQHENNEDSESPRHRNDNDHERGSHRRHRDSIDQDSGSRHHHESDQDSESRPRRDQQHSSGSHHRSENGQQIASRYHQDHEPQVGSPFQQDGNPQRFPGGQPAWWSPRADMTGGRLDMNWNRGGRPPPFRGGFRGTRGRGFRGGRGGFARGRY